MSNMARELRHDTRFVDTSPTAIWHHTPELAGPKPLRRPYWWEIRKVRVVAKAGGEVTRWNVSPIPLLGLIAVALGLVITLGTMVWNLSARLTAAEARATAIEKQAADMAATVINIRDYYNQVRDEQTRRKAVEDYERDKKGKR